MSQDHLQGAIALPHVQPRALRQQRMLHLRKLEFQVLRSFLVFFKFIFFFSVLAVDGITCMSVLRVMTEFWKKKCSFGMALVLCGWMCLVPFNGLFVRILALLKTILTISSENLHVNINTTNKTIWWRFWVTQYAIHLSILLLH